jgi:hypothetical protein
MNQAANSGAIRISAIIPAYNVAPYIGAALDSLLAQSAPFHEIIVVDDGSSDGTEAILAQYQAQAGVRVVRVPNGGQGRARNLALTLASGEFVYFFDADDLLASNFVADMQAMLAQQPEADIVYFSGSSFMDAGCSADFLPAYRRRLSGSFASGVAATGALLQQQSCFASPCLYLSRRSLWQGGALAFLPIIHEDEELITRLTCKAGLSLCTDTVYFARRVRAESTMTQTKNERHASGYLQTLASLAQQCRAERAALAPIEAQMVRRFYSILGGYLAICKAIGARPRYRALLRHVRTLARLPSLRQLVEMTASNDLKAGLSRVRRTLTFSRTG